MIRLEKCCDAHDWSPHFAITCDNSILVITQSRVLLLARKKWNINSETCFADEKHRNSAIFSDFSASHSCLLLLNQKRKRISYWQVQKMFLRLMRSYLSKRCFDEVSEIAAMRSAKLQNVSNESLEITLWDPDSHEDPQSEKNLQVVTHVRYLRCMRTNKTYC